jgi:hypothetical protein
MTTAEVFAYVITPLLAAGIGATIGTIQAFRYQRTTELRRDKRYVIQTLMMYRNVGAHELDWIKALNAVDVVFHSDKKVREVYHTMLAQLRPPLFQNKQWIETFYQLVHEMAQCSDYRNLSLHDIRDYYAPEALDIHYPNMNVKTEPSPPALEDAKPANK